MTIRETIESKEFRSVVNDYRGKGLSPLIAVIAPVATSPSDLRSTIVLGLLDCLAASTYSMTRRLHSLPAGRWIAAVVWPARRAGRWWGDPSPASRVVYGPGGANSPSKIEGVAVGRGSMTTVLYHTSPALRTTSPVSGEESIVLNFATFPKIRRAPLTDGRESGIIRASSKRRPTTLKGNNRGNCKTYLFVSRKVR